MIKFIAFISVYLAAGAVIAAAALLVTRVASSNDFFSYRKEKQEEEIAVIIVFWPICLPIFIAFFLSKSVRYLVDKILDAVK